jgi:apolipoprotein N-acyltransferase
VPTERTLLLPSWADADRGGIVSAESARWFARLASFLAGAALVAAFPMPAAWWWAYVGLVPVLLLVRSAGDRREAVWRSWSASVGFFTALHHWVLPYLSVFAVPLAIVFGLIWVPWGLVAWALLRRPPTPRRVAFALLLLPPSGWSWSSCVPGIAWAGRGGPWG